MNISKLIVRGLLSGLSLLLILQEEGYSFSIGQIVVTGEFKEEFKAKVPIITDGKDGLQVFLGDENDYKRSNLKRYQFIDNIELSTQPDPTQTDRVILFLHNSEPINVPSFNLIIKAKLGSGEIVENFFLAVDYRRTLSVSSEGSKSEELDLLSIAKRFNLGEQSNKAKGSNQISISGSITESTLDPKVIDRLKAEESSADQPKYRNLKEVGVTKEKSDDVTVYRSDNIKIKVEKSSPKKQDLPKKQGDQSKSAVTQSKVNLDSARTYKAKRGDTLSAILRSRGVKGKDKNRFIVALYESNKDSFIESNLHGLLQGASLNFESVEANAAKITDQEATLIVDQHWGQWRQWRLSLVSDNLASLNAPIKNIKSKQPSKPLTEIAKQEGEIAKNNRYVIHVASFKNHEQSKQLVKVLRSKGFNAYETTADIAGKGLFQRVLIDRFSDRGEAIEYASKIKYEGTLSYARVLELPYAIKVGLHVPSAAGELLLEELNRAGANGAHMLKYDNNDNVITLFGAYTTKKEADVVAADLSAKGYHSAVVMP